ncbi:hypothetical protein B0G81_6770 [Paraburkholderia sp. BL6665CI2N2]|uniref:hypothetical protein n=1 Tax=Paraburkholderia sp. BL6665CI2N2 TaxID=1938806 RepID=UPI001066921C|nr:hypothetical protein [Paraburkholderia sp. BL6665CI2N2]TDY26260.1 hypothetical protein B0G81_6770 [Paraburkholderia sp. BL6665CI2N2]
MPYATAIPTPERILAVMRPGYAYAAYAIAAKFGVFAADVKPLLQSMADQGVITKVKFPGKKISQFLLAGTENAAPHRIEQAKRAAEIDPATIAAPRTFSVLTGQLTGYEADIARRAALCMMARPR